MMEFASMNGVELRNLTELDFEEPLYTAEVYVDGKAAGTIREVPDGEMVIDLVAEQKPVVMARVNDYLNSVAEEGEKLPTELFFLDLIQLEMYYQLWREALAEDCGLLVVTFGEESAETFAVATEEEAAEVVRQQGVDQFQVFSCEEDFIISC